MKKSILTAAGIIGGAVLMLAASPAMAHVDIGIHVGIPGVFIQPASVYVEPRPVYVQRVYEQPVYTEPVYEQRVYVQPRPVYVIKGGQRGWHEHRGWHDEDFRGHDRHWERHGDRYHR